MRTDLVALLAIGMTCGSAHSGEVSIDQIAGTYEIIICKSACSFSLPNNVFTRGRVVLLDHALSQKDIHAIDPFPHLFAPAKGCYSLKHVTKAQSYAQIKTVGVTPWQLEDGVLKFELYRSPDAGYFVELGRKGSLLEGKGVSFGAGIADPGFRPDVVVGRRVGPADMSECKPTS